MPINTPDIKELQAIVEWANLTPDVRELSIKFGAVELFISRDRHSPGRTPAAAPSLDAPPAIPAPVTNLAVPAPAVSAIASAGDTTHAADELVVTAPMLGTYYSAPKPGAPAFVEVGSRVTKGTVLCIVEVMKLMNSIEASLDGVVTRILVENNQTVEYGEPLIVIKRDA
jgi:acetyl-CoA carboxylase biotin carboxyl carrier protein